VTELAASTRVTHESYFQRVIRPVLGDVKAREIGPDTLELREFRPQAVLAAVRSSAENRASATTSPRIRGYIDTTRKEGLGA
jgi:hypothetical protein